MHRWVDPPTLQALHSTKARHHASVHAMPHVSFPSFFDEPLHLIAILLGCVEALAEDGEPRT